MEKHWLQSSSRSLGMEPIGYWVFPKINWSFTYPRRATEKHKMQLCNRLQFWIMQLPKAWYEMFYGLRSVQGISMFKCKSRCWEWRRSWWPVMRLHNWRLNAHELRKILISVCLLVTACLCVCEALSASPPCGGPWREERLMNVLEPFPYQESTFQDYGM